MAPLDSDLIDWTVFVETRTALGANFVRILGYFREDGTKSVLEIEDAMRAGDPAPMVLAAHTLKGQSLQFGAVQLVAAAETIEFTARHCLEHREKPDEILELIVALRPMFEDTLALFEQESSPIVQRASFGQMRRFG